MKLLKILGVFAILLLTSCNTQKLISIKDLSITPHQYKNPLIVTPNYYSEKSSFTQFFSLNIGGYKRASKISVDLVNYIRQDLDDQNIKHQVFFIETLIDKEKQLELNSEKNNIWLNPEIADIIKNQNIDLLIKIIPSKINNRYENNSMYNPDGTISDGLSRKLTFNYTITAIDTKTKKEVWKGEYTVNNPSLFNNVAKKLAKKLNQKLIEDQLF